MVFPTGGELESLSQPGFDVFTISVHEQALQETCHQVDLPNRERLFKQQEVIACRIDDMNRLRSLLVQAERQAASTALPPEQLQQRMLAALIQAAEPSNASSTPTAPNKRLRAILKADRFILSHPGEAPTVQTLPAVTDEGITPSTGPLRPWSEKSAFLQLTIQAQPARFRPFDADPGA